MTVTLHILGCGRAGRSLARLWAEAGIFKIGMVVNRSLDSARAAARFIGQGQAAESSAESLSAIAAGDWLMLAAPDGQLASIAEALCGRLSHRPALAFHVSGSETANVLRPIGCPAASVHPVCPFSDPARAVATFPGSYALGEGDDGVLDRVLPAFAAIGAETMRFRPTDKRRYHAATIAASNFLNVLDDMALALAESAGLAREQALKVIVALQRAGLSNIERAGPMVSLTGPIERGDEPICNRLAESARDNELFLALARAAVDLADRKHGRVAAAADNPLRATFSDRDFAHSGDADGGI